MPNLWPFNRAPRTPRAPNREALAAKIQADLQHKQAVDDLAGAHLLVAEMRKVRDRNHFGQSLDHVYEGRRP